MWRRNEECLFTWCGGKSGGKKQGKDNEMGVVSWQIGFLLLVRCRKLVRCGFVEGWHRLEGKRNLISQISKPLYMMRY